MRKLLVACVATAAFCGAPALAADMAVKAPPPSAPPPTPVYSWTGCYIGGNGGYEWNNGKSFYQDPNTTLDPINGSPNTIFGPPHSQIATPNDANSSGWIGGGEVGCNWQMDPRVVLGLEADIDAMNISGSASTFIGPNSAIQVSPTTAVISAGTASEQVSLRWLSTIRARAGLPVLADRGLLFVTGGLAMGGVSSSGSVAVTNCPVYCATWGGSNSSTLTGYTVGGGLEYALTDHWTTKAEYLYYDLGDAGHPLNVISFDNPVLPPYATLGNTVSAVRGSIIRVGLNYLFH
jgi:outer membrane immunogenic protein